MSLLTQTLALTRANLQSLPRRMWISVSMILSVSLVVTVLLGFLAMSNGFRQTLQGAGSEDVAIVLSPGASSELGSQIAAGQIHLFSDLPGIARMETGAPAISAELVVPVDATVAASGLTETVSLRGTGAAVLAVRPGLALAEGRMFTPGTAELVVGARAARDYAGLSVGGSVTLGGASWTVVGLLAPTGTAQDSEILADTGSVQGVYNRAGLVQSLRVRLSDPSALPSLAEAASDTRIGLALQSEKEWFATMAQGTTQLIMYLGWPLALVMAAGAVIGALTTMYSSVADRATEIATLRTIGFSRTAAFLSTWAEAMVLTTVGCAIGVGVTWGVLDGLSASTTGADQMQIGFQLVLSLPVVLQAVVLSLVIGAIGGGLPAYGATRVPLRLALSGRA